VGSTTARRLAWLSAASFLTAVLLSVLDALVVPPSSSGAFCTGPDSATPGDPGVTCQTSTSGSPVLDAVVLSLAGLALVVCVLALVACVVVAVRADVRTRSTWRDAVDGVPPATAARTLLMSAVAFIVLGLVGGFAAVALVPDVFAFAPFRLPDQTGDLYPLIADDYVRLGLVLTLGVGALVLQWLGVLLLLGAGVDAAAVAAVSRRRSARSTSELL
jgi:hypothetical protein